MTEPVLEALFDSAGEHQGRSCGRARGSRDEQPPRPGSSSGEAELAWLLADTVSCYLDTTARNEVFVAIGVGETFAAICLLLDAVTSADAWVEGRLAARLGTWLDAYAGHEGEPRLRLLIREATFGC